MQGTKKFITMLLTMVLLTVAFVCQAAPKVVAVTQVTDRTNSYSGQRVAADLESQLIAILVQSGVYTVVERSQLDSVVKEMGLGSTGMIDASTAVEFGRLTGSDYTVVANIIGADVQFFNNMLYKGHKAKVKLNFKFIDNTTGVIKIAEVLEGSNTVTELETMYPDKDIMLSGAANDVAKKVVERINELNPVTGTIISVSGNSVYVDLGSDMGVKVGQKYTIYREGKVLIHPVTKEILGVEEQNLGILEITEVKPNYSLGEIKKSRGAVTVGAMIKRAKK